MSMHMSLLFLLLIDCCMISYHITQNIDWFIIDCPLSFLFISPSFLFTPLLSSISLYSLYHFTHSSFTPLLSSPLILLCVYRIVYYNIFYSIIFSLSTPPHLPSTSTIPFYSILFYSILRLCVCINQSSNQSINQSII